MQTHWEVKVYIGMSRANGANFYPSDLEHFARNLSETREGLTLAFQTGYWKGAQENCAVITLIIPAKANEPTGGEHEGRWIAEQAASRFGQECCLYTWAPINAALTTRQTQHIRL